MIKSNPDTRVVEANSPSGPTRDWVYRIDPV